MPSSSQTAARFAERIERKINLDTHDLGFLYTLACVAPWRLTGNQRRVRHLPLRYAIWATDEGAAIILDQFKLHAVWRW